MGWDSGVVGTQTSADGDANETTEAGRPVEGPTTDG